MASSLDDFMSDVCTQDTRKRIQVHGELVNYLSLPRSSLACEDVDKFIDGLIGWVQCSNYKISLNGLEVLCLMVDRMGEDFRVHVSTVLPAVVDRLGDAKDQVRDQAQQLLLKLMLPASTPQYVFERMMGTFSHKLWHVREGVLICLQNTLNTYGARSLQLSKVVPSICKLLEDQNSQVREVAVNTLAEIYRHVGEKVRVDLARKGIQQQRLNQIYAKFDDLKASGNMLPTADLAPSRGASVADDEVDFAKPLSTKVPQTRRVPSSASSTASAPSSTLGLPRRIGGQSKSASGGSTSIATAGGVDEELFIKSFEDVPKIQMYSARDLQDQVSKLQSILADCNHDNWEKRIEAMKQMRSLLVMGGADYDEFLPTLRSLESPLLNQVKDLRSQVVREACVTTAYYAQQLGNRFDRMAEVMLPRLIELIPNSAKVMATSGLTAVRFIIQYCHTARLVPVLVGFTTVKSNVIRRHTYEFLNQMLHTWPTHILEKHIAILQDSIKKGISDADSEARAFSRKAFWGFAEHFRDQADALLGSLELSKQKLLQGEMSNSSSSNSINSTEGGRLAHKGRPRSSSQDRHDGGTLTRSLTGPRRQGPSRISSSRSDAGGDLDVDDRDGAGSMRDVYVGRSPSSKIIRSSSAADLSPGVPGSRGGASSKPRSSSVLLAARLAAGSTHSLPRQKSSSSSTSHRTATGLTPSTIERSGRSRSRIGVSQSQPSSRSGSPSSRLTYLTHGSSTSGRADPTTPSRTRRSVIPRSQGTSREASPNRATNYGRERRLSGSKIGTGGKGHILSQRLLRPGTDVEDALQDALTAKNRKRYESYDSDDAASETSSICSERSYSSYSGRTSEIPAEFSSASGSATSLVYGFQDMQDIIAKLGSGSYSERKEGLISLYVQLKANRFLNRVELKKVTEIFTRMFHDPHSKVFSVFLDTLMELVGLHARDLQDWLYILLTRLLIKTGTDMLGSVQAKVQRALDCVRDNFPCDHQFNALTKFIIDQSQSPNLKVKLSLLHYLHALIVNMDPTDFVNSMDTRLALSRIITWTNEPKNTEIRKSAQLVLIALFNLNAPEFSLMLSALPKAFQDGATKILHSHIRSASNENTGDVLSPRNVTSPPGQKRSRPPSRSSLGHPDDMETENLNPEDVHNSIRKMSADIVNLSINSKLDYDDPRKKRDFNSQDSGIQDLRNDSPDAPNPNGKRSHYNPLQYSDENTLNGINKSALAEPYLGVDTDMFNEGFGTDQGEVIDEILSELSNHNERMQERKTAMLSLIKMTREETFREWDKHFKSVLLLLLETLGDTDGQIRALALRVLREILLKQPERFQQYAELSALRVLEAHQDQTKEVVRSAEECATTLANCIPPEQCMLILNPIVQTAKFPVNLAAIKMQNKVIERLPKDCVEKTLEDCIPGLLKGYDDQESSVRKASVFCLVSIYMAIGEALRPYLKDLNGSKMKLLNLYIKRSQGQRDNGSAHGLSSPASSET